jgi:hypothetical protein
LRRGDSITIEHDPDDPVTYVVEGMYYTNEARVIILRLRVDDEGRQLGTGVWRQVR